MDLKESSVRLLVGAGADALQVLTDLRERIEIVHTQEYPNFLAIIFPVFKVLMLALQYQVKTTEQTMSAALSSKS